MFNRHSIITKSWLLNAIEGYKASKNSLYPYSSTAKKLIAIAESSNVALLFEESPIPPPVLTQIKSVLSEPLIPRSKTAALVIKMKAAMQHDYNITNAKQASLHNQENSAIPLLANELWTYVYTLTETKSAYFAIALSCTYFYGLVNSHKHKPAKITINIKLRYSHRVVTSFDQFSYFSSNKELTPEIVTLGIDPIRNKIDIYNAFGKKVNEIIPGTAAHYTHPVITKNLQWLLTFEIHRGKVQIWDLEKREMKHAISLKKYNITESYSHALAVNREEFVLALKSRDDNFSLVRVNANTGKIMMIYDLDVSVSFIVACDKFSFLCGKVLPNHSILLHKFNNNINTPVATSKVKINLIATPFYNAQIFAKYLDDTHLIISFNNCLFKLNHITNKLSKILISHEGIKCFEIIGKQHVVLIPWHIYPSRTHYFCQIDAVEGESRALLAHRYAGEIYGISVNEHLRQSTFSIHTAQAIHVYNIDYDGEKPEDRSTSRLSM